MKSKRILGIILVICLMVPCAVAEEQSGGPLGGLTDWLKQAWKDTSSWVSQAWTDITSWVDGAWGDASKWVERTWNDSSTWVSDIWGDVSTWASDTYDSASETVNVWWTETFNSVAGSKNNIWEWLGQETEEVRAAIAEKTEGIKESAQNELTLKTKETFEGLLKDLQLDEKGISKVLETISAYSGEKGLAVESVERIMLPYLVQLKFDSETSGNGKIPAIAVAQYLTGVIERNNITTEDQAQQLINSLDEALGTK